LYSDYSYESRTGQFAFRVTRINVLREFSPRVGGRGILVMCETFRPNYFADCSLYLYFSFEFYFFALPRTQPGTTCLAGDQGAAVKLFFSRLGEEKIDRELSHGVRAFLSCAASAIWYFRENSVDERANKEWSLYFYC